MTGWAATNTLRDRLDKASWQCSGCNGSRSALCGDCETASRDRDAAALALVEAALDAFEEWGYQRRRFIDGETEIVTLRDAEANALAALRAVREGA